MAQGLKPSDTPVIVREFETRLLLVVLPALFFSNYIYLFFSNWELVPFIFCYFFVFVFFWQHTTHMSVFSFLFSTWDADEASGSGGGVRLVYSVAK